MRAGARRRGRRPHRVRPEGRRLRAGRPRAAAPRSPAQAATAIANVRLTARLAEQARRARPVSRARIVAAQDAERRRIERDIHDGVQQHVVALIMKLRLARNQVGRGERTRRRGARRAAERRRGPARRPARARARHPPAGAVRPAGWWSRSRRAPTGCRSRSRVRADAGAARAAARRRRRGRGLLRGLRGADQRRQARRRAAAPASTCPRRTGGSPSWCTTTASACRGRNGRGHGLTNLRDRVEALGGRLRVDERARRRHQRARRAAGAGAGRWLTGCAWSSPRTTTSCARAPGACWRTPARSRCSPRSATPRSCSTRCAGSAPTPCSPTSGCRPATTWRASTRRTRSRPSTPASGSRCCPSTPTRATRSPCCATAPPASPTCSRTGSATSRT